jgi:hypothetical protein
LAIVSGPFSFLPATLVAIWRPRFGATWLLVGAAIFIAAGIVTMANTTAERMVVIPEVAVPMLSVSRQSGGQMHAKQTPLTPLAEALVAEGFFNSTVRTQSAKRRVHFPDPIRRFQNLSRFGPIRWPNNSVTLH